VRNTLKTVNTFKFEVYFNNCEMKISTDFMKRIVLLLALVTLGISAVAQDAEIKQAQRLVDVDQAGKAITLLQEAITKYPEATKLYYYLGAVQLKTGEAGKALKTFEKGVSVNPEEAINHVGLGAIRMSEKKPTEAKVFFDKALAMTKSKNVAVLQAIAQAYLTDAKYAETALKLLEKAKSIAPNDPKTFLLMSEVDLYRSMGGPAISNCERAARLDPTNGLPHYIIGMVYMRSQNFPLAEENLQKAVSIDPEFTLAYKELGEFYYSIKDGEKAAKAYESYLKLKENPTDQDKTRYAFFLIMAKNFAKASEIFKPILLKPDVSPITVKGAAFAATESGDLPEAQRLFEKYFGMVTEDKIEAGDYNYFGKLLQKQKKDSIAVVYIQKSLVLVPNQPETAQTLAETYFRLRKYNESIAAYSELKKLREKLTSTDNFRLGQALYNTNQFEKADTVFMTFTEAQSKITAGYLWLGRIKAQLDPDAKLDLAKANYDKVIEIASPSPETGANKKDLIEAYKYVGFYYSQRDDLSQAKAYFEKILALDPNDAKAIEVLKELKKAQK
jgi:tetratricopeptide (TPR) repeat protein